MNSVAAFTVAVTGLLLAWVGALLAANHGHALYVVAGGVAVALAAMWRDAR